MRQVFPSADISGERRVDLRGGETQAAKTGADWVMQLRSRVGFGIPALHQFWNQRVGLVIESGSVLDCGEL